MSFALCLGRSSEEFRGFFGPRLKIEALLLHWLAAKFSFEFVVIQLFFSLPLSSFSVKPPFFFFRYMHPEINPLSVFFFFPIQADFLQFFIRFFQYASHYEVQHLHPCTAMLVVRLLGRWDFLLNVLGSKHNPAELLWESALVRIPPTVAWALVSVARRRVLLFVLFSRSLSFPIHTCVL